jgi:chromosome segregation ATPase
MINRNPDGDGAAERLERRWFAAFKAASNVRAECEELLDAMERSEQAWNRARARLSELEALRDALGEELALLDASDVTSVSGEPCRSAAERRVEGAFSCV